MSRTSPLLAMVALAACGQPPLQDIYFDVVAAAHAFESTSVWPDVVEPVNVSIPCGAGTVTAIGTHRGNSSVPSQKLIPVFDVEVTLVDCDVGTGIVTGKVHWTDASDLSHDTVNGTIEDRRGISDWSCDIDVVGHHIDQGNGDNVYAGTICGQQWSYDDYSG